MATVSYKKPLGKDNTPKQVCQNKRCKKLKTLQPIGNFYKTRNSALPTHPFCKECVNALINLENIESVYSVLRTLNTPFIFDEWQVACTTNPENPFGVYLKTLNFSKRRIYGELTWNDSIYSPSGEIDIEEMMLPKKNNKSVTKSQPILKFSNEWQGKYTDEELLYLNEYYASLQKDFKIVTRNHIDYARKIAKASLLMDKTYNKILENSDDKDSSLAYEKAAKNFDALSKSAQFSESQRSANDVSLGCFGRVFDAVEKHNWIPPYVSEEDDVYDKLIKQFANIEKSL